MARKPLQVTRLPDGRYIQGPSPIVGNEPDPSIVATALDMAFNPGNYRPQQQPWEPGLLYGPRAAIANVFGAVDRNIEKPLDSYMGDLARAAFVPPALRGQPKRQTNVLSAPIEDNTNRAVAARAADSAPSLGAQIEQTVLGILPGATVTSRQRSSGQNASVGGVANSYHLTDQARDFVPPKGVSMDTFAAQVKQAMPGFDVINEGDHVHIEPSRKQGTGGVLEAFRNGFDPSYINQALGQVDAWASAAGQPTTVSYDRPAAPRMPELTLPKGTDFTAQDQALQALRPAEVTEVERSRIMRANLFSGLAQGLMNIPESAGVGKVLAMAGAGALAGRGAGLSEVQREVDAFDEKMARYNLAVYQNEAGKAQTLAQEAQVQAQLINQRNMQQWQTDYGQWAQDNKATVTENGIVISKVGADGKVTVTSRPFQNAINASAALQKAQILAAASGQFNAGNMAVAQAQNGLIGAAALRQMQQQASTPEERVDAAMLAPALQSRLIVSNGLISEVLGEDEAKQFAQEAQRRAMAQGLTAGTREYAAGMEDIMTGMLLQATLGLSGDKGFMQRFTNAGAVGQQIFAADRFRDRVTRTTNTAKGTTMQVTEGQ